MADKVTGEKLFSASLQDPQRHFDVTNLLRDPSHGAKLPPGTHATTQARLAELPNFPQVHARIVSKLLTEGVVSVMCNHGVHRSVGVVEMAVQDVTNLRRLQLDIEVIHVELQGREHGIDDVLWRRLCNM